jgi:hypothetical protein
VKAFRFEGSGAEHVVCNVTLELDFLQKKTFVFTSILILL